MTFDAFTAEAMLQAATNTSKNSSDQLADLYKNLKSKNDGGPSQADIDFFNTNKGKTVKILYTSHVGILHELNTSTHGFYPGSRFPFYVKMTAGPAVDSIFEYDRDQVQLID